MRVYLELLAICFLLAFYITFAMTFVHAYSNPEKRVMVYIDEFGEAEIEYWLVLLPSIPVILWYVSEQLKRSAEVET